MSHPNQPSSGITYDPLPLTLEDHGGDTPYNQPPSPGPHSPSPGNSMGYHTPRYDPDDIAPDESSIPMGAAQPRFLGAALYDEYGAPHVRDSYASSHNTAPSAGSEFGGNSSVYALNDTLGAAQRSSTYTAGGYRDDPRESLPMSPVGRSQGRFLEEKNAAYAAPRSKNKRNIVILSVLGGLILLIVAVVIPIYFVVIKPKNNNTDVATGGDSTSSAAAKPSSTGKPGTPVVAVVTGGDGSTVTMEDGTTFTYANKFGGTWYWDPNDPLNNNAQAQSWSPPLNTTFRYGIDKIRGVNLGGWLNTEPFISPALYEPYVNNTPPVIDEWTLSQAMAADTARGGLSQMENHYKTFITEKDFAEIAGAGLNYVRIPLPYWAIEVRDGEPFLPKTSWTYFLKAVQWARKYGIRINLDFHAVPGSQNGWNHSGRLGSINFLLGPMGYANAQRTLDYIRIIAEFISQPQYKDVVTMFGVLNEPQSSFIGQDVLSNFYLEAYNVVRTASGTGQGNGPFISYHDAFLSRDKWAGFLPNADRITLDSHPYLCFQGQSDSPMSSYATTPCKSWGGAVNDSMSAFGMTNAGEFSNAVTDCGLYVNGIGLGVRYEGTYKDGNTWPVIGSCDEWTDWQNYDQATKTAIKNFALASMDALQNYFFWTWKIGNSSVTGKVESPAWSYQLGLENGWMPKDPRQAAGVCGNTDPWNPPLAAWQTGGQGAGQISPAVTSGLPWPPAALSSAGAVTLLPSYTPTGAVPTLPVPSSFPTASGITVTATPSLGSGWANAADTASMMVPIGTCSYLDPWVGPTAAPPSPLCSGGGARRNAAPEPVPAPAITPAPRP